MLRLSQFLDTGDATPSARGLRPRRGRRGSRNRSSELTGRSHCPNTEMRPMTARTRKKGVSIFAPFCLFLRPNCLGRSAQRVANDGQISTETFQLRNQNCYADHSIENGLRPRCAFTGAPSEESYGGFDFQSAESIDRAGAEGLPLSQIPQLPQTRQELSRNGTTEGGAVARRHAPARRKSVAWRPASPKASAFAKATVDETAGRPSASPTPLVDGPRSRKGGFDGTACRDEFRPTG